ncbi:MAG TPA: hypothetical protein PKZ07_14615 [Sedimentisphaerales bacterium]|nr:hypothetical protein [Sedimentisphaerales bacterium]
MNKGKSQLGVSAFLDKYENSERFSGMDGQYYGTFEGEGVNPFTPEDLTAADGIATGTQGGRVPVSKPYILQVYNTTGADATCILFGYNDYSLTTNFGSAAGIVVTVTSGGSYNRLLAQSQNKPFEIGLYRWSCGITAQLDVVLTINYVDANGRTASDPVALSNYKDAYQQQSGILDIWYSTKIDGNTYLSFTVLAATNSSNRLTLSLFPKMISDQANRLVAGGGPTKQFTTPRLSGRNVPIVQINRGGVGVSTPQGFGKVVG